MLLLSADGTEPGFAAWKYELTREGVPFDAVVSYTGAAKTSTLTDARLADYGGDQHAKYDAVILATGDLGHQVDNGNGTTSYLSALTDAEWAALAKFEQTFGVRQLSDYTAPSPAHGLVAVGGASQDGKAGTLTAAGKAAFPYLKGPIPIPNDDPDPAASEAFGYAGTPVDPQNWQTLVSAPGGGAYLGIYTHPDDGREEMVMTVAANENQSHAQLLRHGMLNWVTRGVFLGYQRNYLELQVDDLFLGDDAWDPATHTTNYDPAAASRMSAGDVAQAVSWSASRNVRLDFAFNGGGSALWQEQTGATSDPLVGAIQANKAVVRLRQPHLRPPQPGLLDGARSSPRRSTTTSRGPAPTGSRSTRPRSSPASTPAWPTPGRATRGRSTRRRSTTSSQATTPAATGGVPAGTYDYALTAHSAAGESTASIVPGVAVATAGVSVVVSFNAVCHAASYTLYRRTATSGAWSIVGTLTRPENDPTDDGTAPLTLTITDDQAAGTRRGAAGGQRRRARALRAEPQLPVGAADRGRRLRRHRRVQDLPGRPGQRRRAPSGRVGATFTEGTPPSSFQAVPRYPSNVYYNVSRQGQQLDEYNWIYVAPANGGGCVPIPEVTTCRTTPATWSEYVASENTIMFRHLMGNDPRPHFMHQSNLADYNPALPETDPEPGRDPLPGHRRAAGRYDAAIDRAKAPLVQLTSAQVAATLARQSAWAAHLAAGDVTAWLQDGKLHVKNASAGAVDVPLTGTTVGEPYAGQRSGWKSIAAGAEEVLTPDEPANTKAPTVSGTPRAGETLTAHDGTWTGTPTIGYGHQWQRCDGQGKSCKSIAGATAATYVATADDVGATLRVVVAAGNWIASVSQAPSAATAAVAKAPVAPGDGDRGRGRPGAEVAGRATSRARASRARRAPG